MWLSANRYFVDDHMELAGRGRVPPLARTIDILLIIIIFAKSDVIT